MNGFQCYVLKTSILFDGRDLPLPDRYFCYEDTAYKALDEYLSISDLNSGHVKYMDIKFEDFKE